MSEAIDMAQFVEAKSDQLNADDLIGAPRIITVRKVTGNDGDQPVSIYFEGDNNKPFKPCKTMRRVLLAVWGRNAADYVGRSMRIYRDDSVTFGGLNVGGIRISHMSHIDKDMLVVVMKTKGKKAGIKIEPLVAEVKEMPKQRQTAEQWAADHIAAAQNAADADALAEVMAKGARAMAKLETDKPTLWAEVNAAYAARRAQIEQEGRDTTDMGEGFADDPFGGDDA